MPIGLADDSHPIAGRFENPAEDRHRKTWMIDVGVAGHDHDIQLVPASGFRLLHRHGERCPGKRSMGLPLAEVIQVSTNNASVFPCACAAGAIIRR